MVHPRLKSKDVPSGARTTNVAWVIVRLLRRRLSIRLAMGSRSATRGASKARSASPGTMTASSAIPRPARCSALARWAPRAGRATPTRPAAEWAPRGPGPARPLRAPTLRTVLRTKTVPPAHPMHTPMTVGRMTLMTPTSRPARCAAAAVAASCPHPIPHPRPRPRPSRSPGAAQRPAVGPGSRWIRVAVAAATAKRCA